MSGCRGMAVGTEPNSCHRDFWGCVGMETSNGAFDEKNIGI